MLEHPAAHLFMVTREAVLARLNTLPALPSLVAELLASFDDDEVDSGVIAQRIGHDQSLAARVLRVANSPFYGLSGRVATIHDAIVILGFRTVRSLVVAAAMTGALPHFSHRGLDTRTIWRHAVGVGLAARRLARNSRLNPETAFTAGLLHDVGRIVLLAGFPDAYTAAVNWRQQQDCLTLTAEQAVLGMDHCGAGALLAQQWKLPTCIGDAIAYHHDPSPCESTSLAHVVHLADAIVHALDLDGFEGERVAPVSDAAWNQFNLTGPALNALFAEVEHDFEDTCHALVP